MKEEINKAKGVARRLLNVIGFFILLLLLIITPIIGYYTYTVNFHQTKITCKAKEDSFIVNKTYISSVFPENEYFLKCMRSFNREDSIAYLKSNQYLIDSYGEKVLRQKMSNFGLYLSDMEIPSRMPPDAEINYDVSDYYNQTIAIIAGISAYLVLFVFLYIFFKIFDYIFNGNSIFSRDKILNRLLRIINL